MLGGHYLRSWSATQKSVTLSSAEAELIALVKLRLEMIGMCQLGKDWACNWLAKLYADSNAALGIVHRRGNGRRRHVRVGQLWIQEKAESGELDYKKVHTDANPADLFTKKLPASKLLSHASTMGLRFRPGRTERALEAS